MPEKAILGLVNEGRRLNLRWGVQGASGECSWYSATTNNTGSTDGNDNNDRSGGGEKRSFDQVFKEDIDAK